MSGLQDFLTPEEAGEGRWRFSLGPHLYGAFGGIFGGAVAACTLVAAGRAAPGKVPAALDCRFLRGLPAGVATCTTTVLHHGRSLACVSVDVADEGDRLATRATVSLVAAEALAPLDQPAGGPPTVAGATPWRPPAGVEIPIVATLEPRMAPLGERAIVSAISLPWRSPEAACMAADLCVGPPVAAAVRGEPVSHPNPDLSLRFTGAPTGDELIGVGAVERVAAGVAAVSIEVWSGADLVATGVSTSLLLPA